MNIILKEQFKEHNLQWLEMINNKSFNDLLLNDFENYEETINGIYSDADKFFDNELLK